MMILLMRSGVQFSSGFYGIFVRIMVPTFMASSTVAWARCSLAIIRMDDVRVFYIILFSISAGCVHGFQHVGSCLYGYLNRKYVPHIRECDDVFFPFYASGENGACDFGSQNVSYWDLVRDSLLR